MDAAERGVKICVVGAPGCGKTTLAAAVARKLAVPHIELDGPWWMPDWTPVDLSTFQERVRQVVAGEAWVVEGFYLHEAVAQIVWPQADLIVWLDLPRGLCVKRALRRSLWRVVQRADLWGTNRQSWSVLMPLSVVRFIRRWPSYPAKIEAALSEKAGNARTVVRLRSDREIADWLAEASPALRSFGEHA